MASVKLLLPVKEVDDAELEFEEFVSAVYVLLIKTLGIKFLAYSAYKCKGLVEYYYYDSLYFGSYYSYMVIWIIISSN